MSTGPVDILKRKIIRDVVTLQGMSPPLGKLYAEIIEKMIFECLVNKDYQSQPHCDMKHVDGTYHEAFSKAAAIYGDLLRLIKQSQGKNHDIISLSCFIAGIILLCSDESPIKPSDPLNSIIENARGELNKGGFGLQSLISGLYIRR